MSIIQNIRHQTEADSFHTHTHTGYHQMIYLSRGAARFDIAGRSYTVDRPSVVFIGSNEQHAVRVLGEIYERTTVDLYPHKLSLHSDFRLLSVFSDRPADFCHVLPVEEDYATLDALMRLAWEEWERADREFPNAAERLLCSVLLLLYRRSPQLFSKASGRRSETVRRIKARLESSPTDPPTLELLGREFHMSPYYLAHLFKDMTGYTIKNYHLLCRVAAARELLETTDDSVTDIAARVGFGDAGSLSRYLRRELGTTPSQYRKQFRGQRTSHITSKEK